MFFFYNFSLKLTKNHPKIISKSWQIIPKSPPNHPQTIPKPPPNHPKINFYYLKKTSQNQQKVKNIFEKLDFWHFQPVSSLEPPPKSIKWVWKFIFSLIFVKKWLNFGQIDFRNMVFGSKTDFTTPPKALKALKALIKCTKSTKSTIFPLFYSTKTFHGSAT